jgi:hypothetical protein
MHWGEAVGWSIAGAIGGAIIAWGVAARGSLAAEEVATIVTEITVHNPMPEGVVAAAGAGPAQCPAAAEFGAVALFHGTTAAGAQSILSEGLLPVSRHTAPYPAGSFFTHIGEDAQVAASHWAARSSALYGGRPLVLCGTLSYALFDTLRAQGLIRTSAVPGLPFFPAQTVILPEALGTVNGQIQWTVIPLRF